MTEPAPPLPDARAREDAARRFDRNFVVIAGAGTGKTSLLVERILIAVGSGVAALPAVAAITFTRKAAGEMRERVADGLEALLGGSRGGAISQKDAGRAYLHLTGELAIGPATLEARVLDALDALDRAAITTIDSFCAEILRGHPLEAGIEPGFEIDGGGRIDAMFDERYGPWLGEELGPRAARAEVWRSLLARVPVSVVEGAARAVAGFRIPPEVLRDGAPAIDAKTLFGERALEWARTAAALLVAEPELTAKTREWLEEAGRALSALAHGDSAGLRSAVRGASRLGESTIWSPGRNVAAEHARIFERLFREAAPIIRNVPVLDDAVCARMFEAVRPFGAAFREAALAQGVIGFDGLLVLARDLLRDHPSVRDALKARFRLLLVDEFQDTDPIQYEIVLFLAEAAGSASRDPFATALAPGRLFIVGDPKQSIYRFRGADYAAFERAVEHVVACGGERLSLVSNFRSAKEILAPVNRLFAPGRGGAWSAERGYQPVYEPIHAAATGTSPGIVELWTVAPGRKAPAEERRLFEARAMAAEIRRLHDDAGVAYNDVLVLFRALTSVGTYLRALREAGVPFVAGGGKTFRERPEVAQVLAVLRALAQPADTVALLAYLRSPVGGVPDTELAAHAAAGGRFEAGLAADAARCPALADALGRLEALDRETRTLPADAAVRHVLRRTGLLRLGALAFEGPQRVANLRKLEAKAAELARDGRLTLLQVLDALEERDAAELDSESPMADDRSEAVRILSVHGAKGLESRVVFVPDLARGEHRGGRGDATDAAWIPTPAGHAVALRLARIASNAPRLWRDDDDRRHEAAERLRLLYVALTRAAERLVLIASPDNRSAPWLGALAPWDYDSKHPPADGARLAGDEVRHRLVVEAPKTRPRAEAAIPSGDAAVAGWNAAIVRARAAAGPLFRHPSAADADEARRRGAGSPEETPPRSGALDRDVSRAAGVAVHRWLEAFPQASVDAITAIARPAAVERGADEAAVEREARRVIGGFLASPLADRLREAHVLARELSLLHPAGDGTTWRGRIDLVYRDRDGEVAVVDFKTDADPAGLADRHAGQVAVYRDAVRRALRLEKPPRVELWALRSGKIFPV